MTAPRQFLPNKTYIIRQFVHDRRCGLFDQESFEAFLYCLGCACKKYAQISPHGLTILKYGYELVISETLPEDVDADEWVSQVPRFEGMLNRMVAQYQNHRLGRKHENFWRAYPYDPCTLEDDAARWRALIDVALLPVSSGMSAGLRRFGGVITKAEDIGAVKVIEKPEFHFKWVARADQPEQIELEFVPLPGHQDDIASYRRRYRKALRAGESALLSAPSRKFLDRARWKELTFEDRIEDVFVPRDDSPYFLEVNGNDHQNAYAADAEIAREAKERLQDFKSRYKKALKLMRRASPQDRHAIVFPSGTYWYRLLLHVAVEDHPPDLARAA